MNIFWKLFLFLKLFRKLFLVIPGILRHYNIGGLKGGPQLDPTYAQKREPRGQQMRICPFITSRLYSQAFVVLSHRRKRHFYLYPCLCDYFNWKLCWYNYCLQFKMKKYYIKTWKISHQPCACTKDKSSFKWMSMRIFPQALFEFFQTDW